MKQCLLNYYHEQSDWSVLHLESAKSEFSVEGFHELRVGIKRIRALFEFVEALYPGHWDARSESKPFKRLFKVAGRVRDPQVQLALVAELERKLGFRCDKINFVLEELLISGKQKFVDFVRDFNENEFQQSGIRLESALKNQEEGGAVSRAVSIMNTRLSALKISPELLGNSEELHKLRIRLKAVTFLLGLVSECFPEAVSGKFPVENLKACGALLGRWHDLVVLQELTDALIIPAKKESMIFLAEEKLRETVENELSIFRELIRESFLSLPVPDYL